MTTRWTAVGRGPDGGFTAPAGLRPDELCFAEGTTAATTWGRVHPASGTVPGPGPGPGIADLTAARAWAATARDVATRAFTAAGPDGTVAVVGEGALAVLVRLAVPPDRLAAEGPPAAVAETSGTPAGITAAVRAVRPGGTVLLAVRPLDPVTPLCGHHDLHRPAVRIVPVRWAGDSARPAPPEELVTRALALLVPAPPDRTGTAGQWLRLTPAGEPGPAPHPPAPGA
ncbi:hypothetical protein ACFCX4_09240 [Kitasatospora sp. NPDC056327]|uniref:hypothetical protein n=1 Tax=Kitasatospora sp. NPDC056327 TaxID=3345785 RepID=UPI0035D9CC04